MAVPYSRRNLFHIAGVAAGAIMANRGALAQQPPQGAPTQPPAAGRAPAARRGGGSLGGTNLAPFPPLETRPTVALIKGEDRRKMVYQSLMAIDKDIQPKLKNKKYICIKPNNVTTTNQLGATHPDALRGMLDYFSTRFNGPVVIAESSAGNTMQGFENFGYNKVAAEYPKQKVQLIDLNEEAKYVLLPLIDFNIHLTTVRLAARLMDPDAFVMCAACMKTHNLAIVTLSVKNMVLGSPLHYSSKDTTRWNDKRQYHVGLRQSLYNIYLTAKFLQPNWGATVIDGFEGMEGNGPSSGTPVPSRVVIASTDYIAADRVGAECMGVDANWLGWLKYCGEAGVGQWDLARINVQGAAIADVVRKYQMHGLFEQELKWQGPMEELPQNLGWVTPIGGSHDVALG
jgi:uncharacterized protein (DUF362 family)